MNGLFSQLNSSEATHVFDIIEKQRRLILLLDEEIGRLSGNGETDLWLTPEEISEVVTPPPPVMPAQPQAQMQLQAQPAVTTQTPMIELAMAVLKAGSSLRSETFGEAEYLAGNPDVVASIRTGQYKSGFEHWVLFGLSEGRPARFNSDGRDLKSRIKGLQDLNSYRNTKSLRLKLRQRLGHIYRSVFK